MKLIRFLPALAGAALLAACATPWEVSDVQSVQTAQATGGTAFTKALLTEYAAYAKYEAEVEYEWDDAAIFARKGLRAATGEVVEPSLVTDYSKIPAARAPELNDARARLMGYFAGGARERVPAAAATAQVKFDCWVEEENEGDANSDCRAAFLKIEPELKPKAVAAPTPKIIKTFIVYFDFNKADITKDANKVLADVVAEQKKLQPANIYLSGHTDTVGKSAYNDKLSAKRANAVAAALGKKGVAAKVLDVKSFGKTKLAVPTADNVKEGKNRRVEIYFEK
jgi:outer membrane protein OmpA-like peptidoglycan-associated protein